MPSRTMKAACGSAHSGIFLAGDSAVAEWRTAGATRFVLGSDQMFMRDRARALSDTIRR